MTFLALAELLPAIAEARRDGVGAVIVTVSRDESPLALPSGARFLVRDDGSRVGSLQDDLDTALAAEALRRLAAGESGSRTFEVRDGELADAGVRGGALDVFFEVLSRPQTLIIVGAGHIAVPLAQIARILDYSVTVIDDRPDYATAERFPSATILVGPYRETIRGLELDTAAHIVLVTRGHVHDQACLEEVIQSPARYIGMIGSKRRVRTVLRHLKDQGIYDEQELDRVKAPIGIDIGSQTPAEIALAIMAEIVNLRRGGKAPSLSERLHV